MSRSLKCSWWLLAVLLILVPTVDARACAVCFGDPDSLMAKGAVAGVFVLLGIICAVLITIVGTGLFWLHRSRVLNRTSESDLSNPDPSVAN